MSQKIHIRLILLQLFCLCYLCVKLVLNFFYLWILLLTDQLLCLKPMQQCPTVVVGAPDLNLLIG